MAWVWVHSVGFAAWVWVHDVMVVDGLGLGLPVWWLGFAGWVFC